MVDVVRTVIRLGNFSDGIADIDPDGVGGAEGAGALVNQTFTSATMSIETITYSDGNSDGFINFDGTVGPGGDYVIYDLGAGPIAEPIDQGVWYNVNILLGDGSTLSTSALVFQTDSGETFLTEFANSLDNLVIQSITPTAINNNLFSRTATDSSVDNTTVCFGPGTGIRTPGGDRVIESLRPGDLVCTTDGIARRVVSLIRVPLLSDDAGRAFRIEKDALGTGMPSSPLLLTGNHRLLCASRLVERMFGHRQVLVPIKRFQGLSSVTVLGTDQCTEFFHLELETHSVIWANDALVESCLLGPVALGAMPRAIRSVMALRAVEAPRFPVPPGHQQKAFARRLVRNGHKVVADDYQPVPGALGDDGHRRYAGLAV